MSRRSIRRQRAVVDGAGPWWRDRPRRSKAHPHPSASSDVQRRPGVCCRHSADMATVPPGWLLRSTRPSPVRLRSRRTSRRRSRSRPSRSVSRQQTRDLGVSLNPDTFELLDRLAAQEPARHRPVRQDGVVADIVATGTWQYDGTVSTEVRIVRLDFDFWYSIAEADEVLGDGEAPDLNADGYLYYVRFKPGQWSKSRAFWPDSPGFHTVEAAKVHAESKSPARLPGDRTAQTCRYAGDLLGQFGSAVGADRDVLLWSAVAVRRRLDLGGAERSAAGGRAVMRVVAARREGRPR